VYGTLAVADQKKKQEGRPEEQEKTRTPEAGRRPSGLGEDRKHGVSRRRIDATSGRDWRCGSGRAALIAQRPKVGDAAGMRRGRSGGWRCGWVSRVGGGELVRRQSLALGQGLTEVRRKC
jgi:hypothetical protein